MFESLGPAVPGSLVMEDRKADFVPYLSQEAQQSWIGFPEGHPGLRDVLGCRRYGVGSRGPAPAIWAMARLAAGKRREPSSVSSAALPKAGAVRNPGNEGWIGSDHSSRMPYMALGWKLTSPPAPLGCPLIRQHGQKPHSCVCS